MCELRARLSYVHKTGLSKEFDCVMLELGGGGVSLSVFIRFIIDPYCINSFTFSHFSTIGMLTKITFCVYVWIVYLFRLKKKENLFLKQPYLGALNCSGMLYKIVPDLLSICRNSLCLVHVNVNVNAIAIKKGI